MHTGIADPGRGGEGKGKRDNKMASASVGWSARSRTFARDLEVGEFLAELRAVMDVVHGVVEGTLGDADHLPRKGDKPAGEDEIESVRCKVSILVESWYSYPPVPIPVHRCRCGPR